MLRLSKMNDYAVVVLGHMAQRPGMVMTAPEVAEATGLPSSTVSQVLKRLSHGGLVASHRGAHGGYSLARSPAAMSVADLVEALEGPVALTACVDGAEGQCGVEAVCPMRGGWDRVNTAIRAALESVTLADMLSPYAGAAGSAIPPQDRGRADAEHGRIS
ncbi:MAG: SUF system Fe-S cluster assembly regulator [Alphaproteobacteria bacterium]